MNICGECIHFLGFGDWDLCCDIPHPTTKEVELGVNFPCGHLCYADTPACDCFERKSDND